MFAVGQALVSSDIPRARFSCHLAACKGACCVVGSAGAPVAAQEIPVLNQAWAALRAELPQAAHHAVADRGLTRPSPDGDFELATVGGAECVFVAHTADGTAICAIQRAWLEGRFHWPKPISCHLFPIRISTIGGTDFLNFEYVPEICEPAVVHGRTTDRWLSDELAEPLIRRFGQAWYQEFRTACEDARRTDVP